MKALSTWRLAALGVVLGACALLGPRPETGTAGAPLLSSLASDGAPWSHWEAHSEQRPPFYLRATPLDLALGRTSNNGDGRDHLPASMRALGDRLVGELVARQVVSADAQLEMWPTSDDHGRFTWAIARVRPGAAAAWSWLESDHPDDEGTATDPPRALLPWSVRAVAEKDRARVYADFPTYDSLYRKRVYAECVFTDAAGQKLVAGWRRGEEADRAPGALVDRVCHVVPQPARRDAQPVTLVLDVRAGAVAWPASIAWDEPLAAPAPVAVTPPIAAWPADARAAFERDVRAVDGEDEAVFARSGRRARFTRRGAADPDNQLLDLIAFLEERYDAQGISHHRQPFAWRGLAEANLIAVLPGTLPASENRPVFLLDHIDAAYEEDVFDATHKRVTAPGADDNAGATAALLLAARALAGVPHRHDIWLVHATGEEFPADDLGARALVASLLAMRVPVGALVQLDMIGWRTAGDPLFQVSAGAPVGSLAAANVALALTPAVAPALRAALRPDGDARSYLYNTDGAVYSRAGFPVILFNEHINALENMDRHGYHDTADVAANVDMDYALAVSKVAIQTVAALAR